MPDPFCIWTKLLLHGRYWSILPKAMQRHLTSRRLLLGALHGREQRAWQVLQQNWCDGLCMLPSQTRCEPCRSDCEFMCGFVRSFWIRRVERDLRLFGQKLKFWIHSTAFALRRPLWKCKFSKPLDRRNSTIYILKILSSRHIIDGRLAILDFILFRLCSYPGWWHPRGIP